MTGREDAAAWCDAACAYIRYKPDRGPVREELLGHLEDKTAFYEDGGLDAHAAEEKAVSDMGSPVSTGLLLRKTHKPYLGWCLTATKRILLLTSILTVALMLFGGGIANLRSAALQLAGKQPDYPFCDYNRQVAGYTPVDALVRVKPFQCGDYAFSVADAYLWRGTGGTGVAAFRLNVRPAHFWLGTPMLDLYAVDDLGRQYFAVGAAEDASGQLAMTAYSRSLGDTSCGITVWMPDLRAKWVEIRCPNNDGFVIRLDLPEATT